jgi:hypothetical protein
LSVDRKQCHVVIPRAATVQYCTSRLAMSYCSLYIFTYGKYVQYPLHHNPAIDCIWPLIPFAVNPAKFSRCEQCSAQQPGQAGSSLQLMQVPSPTRGRKMWRAKITPYEQICHPRQSCSTGTEFIKLYYSVEGTLMHICSTVTIDLRL